MQQSHPEYLLEGGYDKGTFRQYLRYYFYLCKKPECPGMSNRLLFVGQW